MVCRAHIIGQAFRQEDTVGPAGDRGRKVVEGEPTGQRVDPHIAADPIRPVRRQKFTRLLSRDPTIRRRHRIFEVEDQRIGARFKPARELSLAIGRDKQQRAHFIYLPFL